ncbi:MAG TPA: TonB-dependent receptor, partial [Candidatus Polarisedimenticolia bacterium]|nr:TonB-dependent receptor [Candidatus Polarisedimenticolia bacterium]
LRPLSSLEIELGLRWDRQTLTAESEVSPRLQLLYLPGARSALRLGWGRYVQPQEASELQVEDGVDRFSPAERADLRSVRLDHTFLGGAHLGVEAYRKEMDHLRPRYENLLNPIQIFPETAPDRVRVSPARSSARGIEILLSVDRNEPFRWWAGCALAAVEDEIQGQMVPRSWDQRRSFDFGLSYRRGDRWELSLAGVYHTGWPSTAVGAGLTPGPDGTPIVQPILGPRNADRYPSFHRLDVRASRQIRLGRGSLSLFVEVTNLYGRENVCCTTDLRYRPRADGTVDVDRAEGHWLRGVPSFGLTWDFGP